VRDASSNYIDLVEARTDSIIQKHLKNRGGIFVNTVSVALFVGAIILNNETPSRYEKLLGRL